MNSEKLGEHLGGKNPSEWSFCRREAVSDCRVFKTFKETFKHPDGRCGDFFINESADWVQTAAILSGSDIFNPRVVLVNQFRFGVKRSSWEFPGGIIESGESPEKAAARELMEETGLVGENAQLLASYSPNPALQSNSAHFVVIENCRRISDTSWDKNEEMEIRAFPVSALDAMVRSGKIYHALAICSVYFLNKYISSHLQSGVDKAP